jgi:hypothetical protein
VCQLVFGGFVGGVFGFDEFESPGGLFMSPMVFWKSLTSLSTASLLRVSVSFSDLTELALLWLSGARAGQPKIG